ncbi:terminase [Eubacterium barkeri]|uniref:Phage terminase, large subunit, PBSX family n=1 Tax=Eubacterium barkeri TaxID=1528 RepID=A0A1H3HDE1_EUBBA|nr:terminase [Eubacterium barkeri]SDY13526.1 phage terminase, large subunit, PBSX family [Eubacterium barkeri]
MADEQLLLSKKYKAFLRCDAPVEFLEGTTAAGKTTVGIFKFMLKVAESDKKLHILSGLDLGTIEKNIINKDLGILDDFGVLVEYNASGRGKHSLPHLLFRTSRGDKIIYVLGYDNKARWKKALGGQYGCLYIDEINIADMEYVREASMRCDYLMATLNPDDPNLPVYKEYINCSRPLAEWAEETPMEIKELLTEEPKPGWVHWFFSFSHNLGLSSEKLEKIKTNVPRGTKLWKNKIEGLRGRATGLIFSNFNRQKHVKSKFWVKQQIKDKKLSFRWFTAGLDTAYSEKSPDALAMIFIGITEKGQIVVLDEEVYNNKDLEISLAPSDIVNRFIAFLERNQKEWGLARDVFIDNADQATIMELKKYKRRYGCIYQFIDAYKKTTIIDRIHLQIGWISQGFYWVLEHCRNHISELESYSWKEDKYEPEDRNDHTINAGQYAWLPFKKKIGVEEK